MQVNTDGLVLRGWYTCLTVAVYGTAERSHGHDQGSSPPPPPPPPQQPGGPKRATKQGMLLRAETIWDSLSHTLSLKLKHPKTRLIAAYIVMLKVLCSVIEEWEKDDQYNGSPPRPAPRGPRTPPGPPPPDDDDEEQVHVPGWNCPVHILLFPFSPLMI